MSDIYYHQLGWVGGRFLGNYESVLLSFHTPIWNSASPIPTTGLLLWPTM